MDEKYKNKSAAYANYFINTRKELLELIPKKLREGNLLEIGAGSGNTITYAKLHGYADHVYGVELCELENSNQSNPVIDQFIIGNIEKITLPYEQRFFKIIICGDVLEHLVNPYELLIRIQELLSDDGVIIASLPNIREFNTMKQIFFQGDFKYVEAGILDKTHLRFFAKKNMIELFENSGYVVSSTISANRCDFKRYLKQFRLFKLFTCIFKHLFEEFFTIQYFIVAHKKASNV